MRAALCEGMAMRFSRLVIAALLLLPLAAVAAPPDGGKGPQGPSGPLAQPRQWGALLVSGDASIPAFDNMVNGLARRLNGPAFARGKIVAVTARTPSPAGPSTVAGIAQAARQLQLAPDEGCLVFLTAHG